MICFTILSIIININLLDRTEENIETQSYFLSVVLVILGNFLIYQSRLSRLNSLINVIFYSNLVYQSQLDYLTGYVDPKLIKISYILILSIRIIFGLRPVTFLIYSILVFISLYLIYFFSKGGMGGGDVKLYALMGLTLGFKATLRNLYIASLIALLYFLKEMFMKKKIKGRKLPFLPFILLSFLFNYLEIIF